MKCQSESSTIKSPKKRNSKYAHLTPEEKEEAYRKKALESKLKKNEERFANLVEGWDYLVCQECGWKAGELTMHLKIHDITPEEYKEKYGLRVLKAQKYVENVKGANNPAYQHGGKYSPFSKKFIHGYDEEWHKEHAKKVSEYMKQNPGEFQWQYYLDEADGDEQLAKELHMKHQRKTLDYFIDKYGEKEGKKRHKLKTERWIHSFKKNNFSQVSQELFDAVMVKYDAAGDVYYATLERPEMKGYKNKEYILETDNSYVRPDFVDLNTKKIIEFDGDYWHSKAAANPERESKRDDQIQKQGYEVHHVKEYEYRENPEKVVQECLTFLTQ